MTTPNKSNQTLQTTQNQTVTVNVPGVGKITVSGTRPQTMSLTEKQQALATITTAFQKKYGPDVVYIGANSIPERGRISTGLDELDTVLEGGLPMGGVIELYGKDGAGKTALALHIGARVQNLIWVDVEHKWDAKQAAKMGIEDANIMVLEPIDFESIWEMLFQYATLGVDMIVLDSVAAQVPEATQKETKDMTATPKIASVAKFLSDRLMSLLNICFRTGTTLVFLNQERDNVNKFGFGDTTHSFGGHALKHYALLRLVIDRVGWIKHPDLPKPYGANLVVTVKKSSISEPMGRAELSYVFARGFINDPGDIAAIRKELVANSKQGKTKIAASDNGTVVITEEERETP